MSRKTDSARDSNGPGVQATLASSSNSNEPSRRVDEHGRRDQWDRGGVYIDGEFSLEATKELLADRFSPLEQQLPESVGEFVRVEAKREYVAQYTTESDDTAQAGTRTVLKIFPRGPNLNDWTVSLETQDTTGDNSLISTWLHPDTISTDSPESAIATALAVMRGYRDSKPDR